MAAAIATIALVAMAVVVGEQLLHARSNPGEQQCNIGTATEHGCRALVGSIDPAVRYITDQAGVVAQLVA